MFSVENSTRKINLNKIISTALLAAKFTKMDGKRIATIRKVGFGMTQVKFADFINIKYCTLCSWERNRYSPSSSAASLLLVAEQYPEVFIKMRARLLNSIKQHVKL